MKWKRRRAVGSHRGTRVLHVLRGQLGREAVREGRRGQRERKQSERTCSYPLLTLELCIPGVSAICTICNGRRQILRNRDLLMILEEVVKFLLGAVLDLGERRQTMLLTLCTKQALFKACLKKVSSQETHVLHIQLFKINCKQPVFMLLQELNFYWHESKSGGLPVSFIHMVLRWIFQWDNPTTRLTFRASWFDW